MSQRAYPWLDDRDEHGLTLGERYREMHKKATAKLADLHFRADEPAEAAALYRELLQAEPTMEGLVRNLFRCYHKLGDRSALVREERQLREALREAYYNPDDPDDDPGRYQPNAQTVALFERFLGDLTVREPAG
jgi:two-component SAPR family response regulator